jgi:hypothetical protein
MMSRYHLTTICTDSSRPNTPKHAKIFSACGEYLISISQNIPGQLPSSINTPTPDRTPAYHQGQAMVSGGTGGAPSCRDATARAGTTLLLSAKPY